jgi:hypothetical protein
MIANMVAVRLVEILQSQGTFQSCGCTLNNNLVITGFVGVIGIVGAVVEPSTRGCFFEPRVGVGDRRRVLAWMKSMVDCAFEGLVIIHIIS